MQRKHVIQTFWDLESGGINTITLIGLFQLHSKLTIKMEEKVIPDVRHLEIRNTSTGLSFPCCPTIEIAGPQSDDLSEGKNESEH
ncbi:hypothetical protein CRM22_002007 [Opisthorchis felineus]|uniref:Uncharacterized protein n=1 Tax=Opisthorchis felineus TaxID=147828 RepID=A0A4S2MEH7_OPIFE|nr:hypothetical protein CRM22_002007 [Opisthorchis felineus]